MTNSHFTSNSLSSSVYNSMRRLNLRSRSYLSIAHIFSTLLKTPYVFLGCCDPAGCISLYGSFFAQQADCCYPPLLWIRIVHKDTGRSSFKQGTIYFNQRNKTGEGMVSLQEACLPCICLELPCLLLHGLVSNLACQVWRWSYSSFGFQTIFVLDTADSSLDLFLPGHKCPGIMSRIYWFKGHRFSKKKGSANFTVMWKKQLPVMAHCPSCLWDA